ncbi:MAG TPA: winged helix-turn-helix domain-containing protein [Pyrinomonadaceae bacterium]|jgi:Tol biopolymer transport system component/DNA-binding winged helix-turn-helix (wHTH) protein
MGNQLKQLFEFGPFRLDTGERVLTRAGRLVPLTPKALETLTALVRHGGRVMEKEELLKEVWPGTYVEDATLAQNIFTLRRALGNGQGDGLKYIETIPRRGYRFIAPVRELPYEEPAVEQAETPAAEADDTAPSGSAHVTDTGQQAADVAVVPAAGAYQVVPGAMTEGDLRAAATLPAQTPRRGRLAVFVIAAALLGVTAAAVFLLYNFSVRRQARPRPGQAGAAQTMRLTRLPINGRVEGAGLSPDGNLVAYVLNDGGRRSVWVKQTTAASRAQQIVAPTTDQMGGAAFSRDGRYVYYATFSAARQRVTMYAVPSLGGPAKQIVEDINSPPSFAPDGRIAFVRADYAQPQPVSRLIVADADGTNERVLATRTVPAFIDAPAWSPDGQLLAFAARTLEPPPGYATINTIRVSDGAEQPLGDRRWTGVGQMEWLPDGSGLVAQLVEQELNPAQLWQISYPGGELRRLTNDLNSYAGVSLSADASALLTAQTDLVSNVWVAPPGDLTRPAQVTQGPGKYDGYYGLTWLPDGKIVYSSIASGAWDLWLMNADGGEARQLTVDARSNYGPAASPDGRYVVFVSNRTGGPFHVWRMNADGSNQVQLTNGDGENFAHVTADGRWVIYATGGFRNDSYVWKVPIEGGQPVRLTEQGASWPFPAPDGKQFACLYQPGTNAQPKLAVYAMDGGRPVKTFDLPETFRANVVWSADGRAIHYLDGRGSVPNIWAQPLDGGAPRPVTDFKTEGVIAYDWARDGRLACARGVETVGVVLIRDFR